MPAFSDSFRRTIVKGFISGLGWAIGASIGFTLFITFVGNIFNFLNHVPILGNLIAPFEKLLENPTSPKQNFTPTNRVSP